MWLFTQHGYLAITENKENESLLHVRARIKGDIERYFTKTKVLHTPQNDYQYRANIPRAQVVEAVANIVKHINYHSYKKTVADHRRSKYLNDIWETTIAMEEEIEHGRRDAATTLD